jgi:beta-galactosidase
VTVTLRGATRLPLVRRALVSLCFLPAAVAAQAPAPWSAGPDPRVRHTINADWRFLPDGVEFAERPAYVIDDATWQRVSIPHTWNAREPFDDVDSYRRGTSWYRKRLVIPDSLRGRRLWLQFEGANQVADVYVNGAFVGRHEGGYTGFTLDATKWLRAGADSANLVAVRVDNGHDPMIPPLGIGFALYGGIYRDVWLVATDPVHVTLADHGGPGVYVETPAVSRERAEVTVRGTIANDAGTAKALRVVATIVDAQGVRVAQGEGEVRAGAGASGSFALRATVARPHLWSPDDPYLYTVYTDVYEGDVLRDRVRSPLGLRWFRFTADSGFFLNGEHLPLRGTNRHQDYAGIGSALSNRQHLRDLEIIKEMGANFLRLAHYPQDPAVLEAADRLGLLIWEEVPLVNHVTRDPRFVANSHRMLREMIRQHYNHPSVVTWGIMNEILLWSEQGERVGTVPDTGYTRWVRDFAAGMDSVARAEDPARYTTMAIHGSQQYERTGISDVTQLLGLNLYNGWYGGKIEEFGRHIDRLHGLHPKQAIIISEYGSGSDLALNSTAPERFDHSGSYHRLFHEGYLRQARQRPWLAGTAIWNQFDFSQPHIGEPLPNLNKKGMLTFDRRPKDVYYMYKANWNPAPMTYIASRDWAHRAGVLAPGARTVAQPVDVYSNQPRVELLLNGRSLGVRVPDDVKKASWMVPFVAGDNVLEARAPGGSAAAADRLVIRFDAVPADLRRSEVRELAVNVGSKAQYADADGLVWLPDQPWRAGSFGFTGGAGTEAMMSRNYAITHTDKTGMYFTHRAGIRGYRMDLPPGEYLVELYLVEPEDRAAGTRVFDVLANGRLVLDDLDLAATAGFRHAAMQSFTTTVAGDGLQLDFRPVKGEPVLSGIRVVRQ